MQKSYIFSFVAVVATIVLMTYAATAIPFIYANKYFVLLASAYFMLVVWFSCHVIYGFVLEENSIEKMRKNKLLPYITFSIMPLAVGYVLTFLLPIAVDMFSANTVVREYRLVKTKDLNARGTRSLSEVYATDRSRKLISFRLRDYTLQKLNLNIDEYFLVSGRDSYFGLVIDEINGVSLEDKSRTFWLYQPNPSFKRDS